VTQDDAGRRLPAQGLGDERGRRGREQDDARADRVRRAGHHVAEVAQHVGRHRGRVQEHPAQHGRADRVQAELEAGDHAQVAAPAARAPEEVGVLGLRGAQDPAVGRDGLDREQVVGRVAALALDPSRPASQDQPANAGGGDAPARDRQAVRLRRRVELAPREPGLGAARARHRVDLDALHGPQVDHHPVVAHRVAGDVVPAAVDGDRQAARPGEADRRRHVAGTGAAGDQRGPAVGHRVEDLAQVVVGRVRGVGDGTPEPGRPQPLRRGGAPVLRIVLSSARGRHGALVPRSVGLGAATLRRSGARAIAYTHQARHGARGDF
jgi:hypothetical protein